ncbi:CLUMA_CG001382, isoform A [Clunio marinus]|uniref:CLUMA_CG001382, isoform A n=1 Tax=Clunio marinus TaxID=568069 RepID=A0A1J1HMX4_9DIPT|nr:CLUMA_CG001382, isoform A [Clunio marinus]
MTCNLTINFLNDQTIYCPGQVLSGNVFLTKLGIFLIVLDNHPTNFICLGCVTIEIMETSQFSGLRLTVNGLAICKFRDSHDESFFRRDTTFTGEERFINDSVYLFGTSRGDSKEFKPGTHKYQFSYRISHTIPSSVKAKHGKIRYNVEANLQTSWEFDVYARRSFTIIRFEDLSFRFDLMLPTSEEIVTSFCCWSCKTKPITMRVKLPFTGYVPEQSIRLNILIDNRCGFDVYRTVISLKKKFTFISQQPSIRVWQEHKTLVKNIIDGAKNGRDTKILGIIEIPPFTLPTNDDISKVVKISYNVQVSLDVVGFISKPKISIPIIIGSKPLKFGITQF